MAKTGEPQDRIPPQAIDVERAILGAMLLEKEAIAKAIELLDADCFYRDAHRKIFQAIVTLFDRGEPADDVTVINELRTHRELEAIGGASYLAELATEVATPANVEYHARIVQEKSRLRKTIVQATQLATVAYGEAKEVDELLDNTIDELVALRQAGMQGTDKDFRNILSISNLISTEYEKPTQLLGREGDPPLLATHQTLVIGADRGRGKTISCLNIGMCLACGMRAYGLWEPEKPIKVFYVHAEAEREYFVQDQARKMLADAERLSSEQRSLIETNLEIAIGADLADGETLDVRNPEHREMLGQKAGELGAELLMLDPLYYVSGGIDVEKAQDMQNIGQCLRAVRNLAGCAVLTTTHFNKAGHIAGSYALEAFASSIIELQALDRLEGFDKYDCGIYLTKVRNGWPRDGWDSWHVILNPDTLWYDLSNRILPNLDELRGEKLGRHREYTIDAVAEILDVEGDLSYQTLVKAVQEKCRCSDRTAKRLISQAKKQGIIRTHERKLTLERPF